MWKILLNCPSESCTDHSSGLREWVACSLAFPTPLWTVNIFTSTLETISTIICPLKNSSLFLSFLHLWVRFSIFKTFTGPLCFSVYIFSFPLLIFIWDYYHLIITLYYYDISFLLIMCWKYFSLFFPWF